MLFYRGQLHPQNVVVAVLDQAAQSGAGSSGLYPNEIVLMSRENYDNFRCMHNHSCCYLRIIETEIR